MANNERHKLYKRAAVVRRSLQKKTTHRTEDWEDFEGEGGAVRVVRKSLSLEEVVLKLLKEEAEQAAVESDSVQSGIVLSIHKGRCDVFHDGRTVDCRLSPALERVQQTDIAVGDRVTLDNKGNEWMAVRTLPRRTKLSRPDPGVVTRERVVVANVDIVVVVVSVGEPPLHPRIIDRYLIAIQRGGARAAIAVNKQDLLTDPSELDVLQPYQAMGIPTCRCSATGSRGLEGLLDLIRGQTAAFVGHSGVGKSSLVAAIRPGLNPEVGTVSGGYGRGTHTTRRSTLYDLGDGTKLIDTPGIREFGLWQLDREELLWGFPEFAGRECKFRDCTHTVEPDCGVLRALEGGEVAQHRYDTFVRLLSGISG